MGLVIFNILNIYLKIQNGRLDWSNSTIVIVFVITVINLGCQLVLLLAHLFTHPREVWSIIANTPSYLAFTGAYSQTMVIHAFCNVDDVSWGTKGSGGSGVPKYQINKVYFVSTW